MADMNPFHPDYGAPGEVAPQPLPPPAAQAPQEDLATRWRNFLGDPASRAALISFGAQLAQPVAIGQNTMGHIGQAIGAAGTGATKAAQIQEREVDNESKQVLRESQANAATSRAQTAEANANTAATRAEAYGAAVESRNQLNQARAESEVYRRRALEAQAELLFAKAASTPDVVEQQRLRTEAQTLRAAAQARNLDARTELSLDPEARRQQSELTDAQIARNRGQANRANAQAEAVPQDTETRRREQQRKEVQGTQTIEGREAYRAGRLEAQDRRDYDNYVKGVETRNKAILGTGQKEPVLSVDEWAKSRTRTPKSGAPAGGGSSPLPPAPQDPALRNANTTYLGANGKPYLWDGSNWIKQGQ